MYNDIQNGIVLDNSILPSGNNKGKKRHPLLRFTINAIAKLRPDGSIDPRKGFFDCDEMERILKIQNKGTEDKSIFYKPKKEAKRRKSDTLKTPTKRIRFKRKSNRQIMGKLLDDAIFLEKLSKNPDFGKVSFDAAVGKDIVDMSGKYMKEHALEAVMYFEKKKDFWSECSKMKPVSNWGIKNE